jgi:Tfp pilus assembly protein FimV
MPRTRVRRRRALLAASLLAAAALVGTRASAADESSRASTSTVRVVRPGDTLWSIALEAAPGRDPRPVVDAIERLNDVRSSELVPGLELRIPVAA